MKQLDDFFKVRQEIFDYFGYVEDWVVIPIDDARDYIWQLNGRYDDDGKVIGGDVVYASKMEDFEDGEYYGNSIYTQRFLPKWVYRGEDYTMIVVDTHVDGNKFLQIFDNSKELKDDDKVPYSGSLF